MSKQMKLVATALIGILLIVGIIVWYVTGNASKLSTFSTSNSNWKIEIIQDRQQEQIRYQFEYMGAEPSIEGFSFQVINGELHTTISEPNKTSVPFVYTLINHESTPNPLKGPIDIHMKWNAKEETLTLQKQ